MTLTPSWTRFSECYTEFPELQLAVDCSCLPFEAGLFERANEAGHGMQRALREMEELEGGAIANPDEQRMVGHYWLRNSALAPDTELSQQIDDTLAAVKAFTAEVHEGTVRGQGGKFEQLLVIGIGGSALGPQFVSNALTVPGKAPLGVFFFDNTDPDGMDRVLAQLEGKLGQTLCVVISKSGGTKETRNGMVEARAAYEAAGLDFAKHAVATTGVGSELDKRAAADGWLRRFEMWDWVGGRTSEMSAVGLLPAALQGIDIDQLLAGARACDEATSQRRVQDNPAAQLALMWFEAARGHGERAMVVLPYKDCLELFSKYLQQLVMESLGKKLDREQKHVEQGLTVYGNKGSTDQHAYVQQLCDGRNDFFVTFVEVLQDRAGDSIDVEPGIKTGDYLSGFLLGSRKALADGDRPSITLTINQVNAFSVGVLIALYERAVGLYASLININAYHQPGVEAGKKAAAAALDLQVKLVKFLAEQSAPQTAAQIATGISAPDEAVTVFKICKHLAANGRSVQQLGGEGAEATFVTRN